jgi:hypothetical protein
MYHIASMRCMRATFFATTRSFLTHEEKIPPRIISDARRDGI